MLPDRDDLVWIDYPAGGARTGQPLAGACAFPARLSPAGAVHRGLSAH